MILNNSKITGLKNKKDDFNINIKKNILTDNFIFCFFIIKLFLTFFFFGSFMFNSSNSSPKQNNFNSIQDILNGKIESQSDSLNNEEIRSLTAYKKTPNIKSNNLF